MYIFLLILGSLNLSEPPGFASWASDILSEAARGQTPVRLVWNQGTAPADIESQLLLRGVVLTTAMTAARIEATTQELANGDIRLTLRLIDAAGLVLNTGSQLYRKPGPAWKRNFDRIAAPILVTAATGLTIYLLYNVRSR